MTPAEIRRRLIGRQEIALLDLREEDVFAQAHPLFAASLPLSRLELEILDRVPRRDTPVVLYDDGDGLSGRAQEILAELGYAAVSVLHGGLESWRAAGGEVFRDVNAPSKAFGELVEQEAHTPSLPASEVKRLLESKGDLVVLDARRFEEYRTMSIPRGVSVPGAELVLRAAALAPDPDTTIVVNCAGRTRSLIGAQSLRNAGLPNPVYALRNGTIGWTLAGFELETGQRRRFPDVPAAHLQRAREAARAVAYRAGVRHLRHADLAALKAEAGRTTYLFDVRAPEEYAARHLHGFRSAPGGQLVQETDHFAPVRGARIVLFDDLGPRADMTASWLAQMGWDAIVLDQVPDNALKADGPWRPTLPLRPAAETITADMLEKLLAADQATLLDLGPSPAYRRGHIAGSHFVIRARLEQDLPADLPREKPLVLISSDGEQARFAAPELAALGFRPLVLKGGLAAWSPRPLANGDGAPFSAFDDVYRRPYEGTDNAAEAMQAYLDWEYGLVAQLRRDATHGFTVLPAPAAETRRPKAAAVPRFYYSPNACSLGVHIAFEEAGAPYQAIRVRVAEGEQKLPDYLAVNPLGRIPAALIDGRLLTECGALLTWIAHSNPGSGLLPLDDPFLTAKAIEWLGWFASTVHVSFAQAWRSERFTDEAATAAGLAKDAPARIRGHFRRVEGQLAGAGPWLLGERYSVADPYALVFHRWGNKFGLDMTAYPAWNAHAARLYQRPAARRALEQEELAPILAAAAE